MKTLLQCTILLVVAIASVFAADMPPPTQVQTGKLSTVRLLATGRLSQPAPDGMRFLFMVTPNPGTQGTFTLKETRDFRIDGQSYRELSQPQLGREWEPSTEIDSAESFFAKQPAARRLAPEDISGAQILVVRIGGAALPPGGRGEITLHVGFEKEVEPFSFSFRLPGNAANANSPAVTMTGPPAAPAAGVTRFVAREGVGFAPWTFDLKLDAGAVSGAVYQHSSDTGGMRTSATGPFEILNGRREGQTVTFKVRGPLGERVASFTGEVSGDAIRFTRSLELQPGASPGLHGILGARGATEFVAQKVEP